METAQWPQEIVVKPIEDIVVTNTCPKPAAPPEKKPRPQKEQALNCPRCHSTNTKFCYYNNYSLTQPRYFCKTCRRYWTEGGSLRNIPVGGGSRKNRRSSSSASSSSSSSNKKLPHLVTAPPSLSLISTQTNPKIHVGQDLNLAFPATTRDFRNITELVQQNSSSRSSSSNNNNNNNSNMSASASSSSSSTSTTTNSTASASASRLSALELLTGITSSSRGLNSFMPLPVPVDPNNTSTLYTCGFPQLQDFKPTPNFSLEGIGSSLQSVQETSGRLLFSFEDLKMDQQNNKHQQAGDSTGYWTGMLGGGGSW